MGVRIIEDEQRASPGSCAIKPVPAAIGACIPRTSPATRSSASACIRRAGGAATRAEAIKAALAEQVAAPPQIVGIAGHAERPLTRDAAVGITPVASIRGQ
jgi:hypothetical protein